MVGVQPKVLQWARQTAGLSLEDAARALGLGSARGRSGVERLAAFESGLEPSRSTLLEMAKVYRRPLLAFYLEEPPPAGDRGQDFRTLPGRERYSSELDALVRNIKARQGLIRSVLEDNEAEPIHFVGSATSREPVARFAAVIRDHLGFSLAEFRSKKTFDDAFSYARGKIENVGVFVLLLGNLGSYHTNIPVEVFRGFAIADRVAPLIVINDLDARAAWSFTAFHEFAHLWLGATGVSGGNETQNRLEQYCNDVAGEILLPESDIDSLSKLKRVHSFEALVEEISGFAEARRVSRSMVAYRLVRTGIIPSQVWKRLTEAFSEQWVQRKQQETEKRSDAEGGPNYYVVRRHRVGRALLGLVRRSLDDGTITYTRAARILGVKARNVEPLLATVRGAG